MAGGVSTPALVAAAGAAGALGFLPAGYKSAAGLRAEIGAVMARTKALAPKPDRIEARHRPLRAAVAKAGDVQRMSLWAGTGYRLAADRDAAVVIDSLCA